MKFAAFILLAFLSGSALAAARVVVPSEWVRCDVEYASFAIRLR